MKRKNRYDIYMEILQKDNPAYYNYFMERKRFAEEALQRESERKLNSIIQASLAEALKEEFTKQLKD